MRWEVGGGEEEKLASKGQGSGFGYLNALGGRWRGCHVPAFGYTWRFLPAGAPGLVSASSCQLLAAGGGILPPPAQRLPLQPPAPTSTIPLWASGGPRPVHPCSPNSSTGHPVTNISKPSTPPPGAHPHHIAPPRPSSPPLP